MYAHFSNQYITARSSCVEIKRAVGTSYSSLSCTRIAYISYRFIINSYIIIMYIYCPRAQHCVRLETEFSYNQYLLNHRVHYYYSFTYATAHVYIISEYVSAGLFSQSKNVRIDLTQPCAHNPCIGIFSVGDKKNMHIILL